VIRRALLIALAVLLLAPAAAAAGEPDPLEPAYDVDLQGADDGFRWTGRMTLSVANPDLAPLQRIWIRLWGNGRRGCASRAVRVTVVSGAVAGAEAVRCTAVPLDLAVPLPTGARAAVTLDVDIRVPAFVDRFGRGGRGLALLSNALPALAHREDGRWRLDRFFGSGEAWTYPAADWRVRLSPPAGVQVAAPGVPQGDGTRLLSRGRDYSWAAGRLRSLRRTVDGVAVTVWAPRRGAFSRDLARGMRLVQRRLPRLARLFGPYGWPDLQVVLTDAAGMEHTAMVMTPPADFVLTHELGHEWWFALIGDDQAAAPWLDEGFATWAESAARDRPVRCVGPRLARLTTRGVNFFRNRLFEYGAAVYGGGSCLLARLERRMGRARFRAALRAYAVGHRYGWSTAEAFMAAMDGAAGSRPLGDLWRAYRVR
jgi:hypothetical protein